MYNYYNEVRGAEMVKKSSKKGTPNVAKNDDISKQTVAVLLVIAVVLAVITTWVVSNRVQFRREFITNNEGRVNLEILPQNPPENQTGGQGGQVAVEIEPTEPVVEEEPQQEEMPAEEETQPAAQ